MGGGDGVAEQQDIIIVPEGWVGCSKVGCHISIEGSGSANGTITCGRYLTLNYP